MSTVHMHRREDGVAGGSENGGSPRSGATTSRSVDTHPHSPMAALSLSEANRTATSSASSSIANLAALVPPSMRARTSAGGNGSGRAVPAVSGASLDAAPPATKPSRRRNGYLSVHGQDSSDTAEPPDGASRSQSPPRSSTGNCTPLPSSGRALSEVSASTVDDEAGHSATSSAPSSGHLRARASDYAPLPEVTEAPPPAQPQLPKLARQRFGFETAPTAPTNVHNYHQPAAPSSPPLPPPPPPPTLPPAAALDCLGDDDEGWRDTDVAVANAAATAPTADASTSAPAQVSPASPLPPMTAAPPQPPKKSSTDGAGDHLEDTGFTPLPELPPEPRAGKGAAPAAQRKEARPATAENRNPSSRTPSGRRPTQSVQTARARAQQRRRAPSSSPCSRGTPVSPQPEFFPGAKRLDDSRLPLSTKLVLGTTFAIGVALSLYLARSVYRYASVSIKEPVSPGSASKFAQSRMPKKVEVSDKEAAKVARDIRDRIVTNMQSAIK